MDKQSEVNPILFARMPAAAQGMDEVNPDQADRELAHKAGVKQNKENAKAFLFLAQKSLNGMDEATRSQSHFYTQKSRLGVFF